jgi:type IV pilus assembly protein PilM
MATTIGLDIGSSAVRAVQLGVSRGPATLRKLGQVMLPHDAVRDGEVADIGAVADAVRTLWSRYGFKGRKIALGVANQQVVVRQVDVPYLPEDDLRRSLQYQAQDHIPIPVDQAILDFSLLENYESDNGEKFSRILLVAAHREMVDRLVETVRQAKLEPVGIDLAAFAMMRSLAPPSVLEERQSEVLIDVGASVTNVVIHDNGVPQFVRILLMGGRDITEGLVNTLGLSFDEAESAKAATGLVDTGGLPPDEPATRIVAEHGGRFLEEIRGSVDYYSAQSGSVPVRRVVISGGGSQLPNLRERLADTLGLPVDRGHPMQELRIGKVGLDNEQLIEAEPYLAVAIGLALGAAES